MQIRKPRDLWTEILNLKRQIRELRHAVQLGNASISAGSLTITDEGKFTVQNEDGLNVIYVGPTYVDGTRVGYGLLVQRSDGAGGSESFFNASLEDDTANPVLGVRDAQSNSVFSIDKAAQQGLARPFQQQPFAPRDRRRWPATQGDGWQELHTTYVKKQHPKIEVGIGHTTDGDSTAKGEVRLMVDGVEAARDTVAFGIAFRFLPAVALPGTHLAGYYVTVEARRTTSVGHVECTVFSAIMREQ